MDLKIKPEYSKHIIAFGGTGKIELGARPQSQLRKLAILSYSNPGLKLFFAGDIPSLADLQKAELEAAMKTAPPKASANKINNGNKENPR